MQKSLPFCRRPEDRVASYSELLCRIEGVWNSLNSATLTELPLAALTATTDLPQILAAAPSQDTVPLGATQPVTAPQTLSRGTRRTWLGLAGVVAISGLSVLAFTRPRREAPVQPLLVPSGWSEPLFRGRSLQGWNQKIACHSFQRN